MIRVQIRVHPGARAERVALLEDGTLDIAVRAPASDGRANAAVVETIGKIAGLRRREVRLIRGERSRLKLVELELSSMDDLRRRLARKPTKAPGH